MAEPEQFDVVVIGAGFAGLSAAKGYVKCAPETNLIIFDDHKTLGGVWSEDQIYDGLRTNNHRGTLEFPDYPFHDGLGIKHGEHMTGESVHQYLIEYAERFDLIRRLRHEVNVLEAEQLDGGGGWKLLVETPQGRSSVLAKKLIVGTGLTARPQKMTLPGQDDYNAPFLHAGGLARGAANISSDPRVERVTIYGGSKFAWDSVYNFATAGKEIDWIIRKSGHGPTFISDVYAKLPFIGEVWSERLVTTRFMSWFSPCCFGGLDGSSWWRWLLHSTWLGQKIVSGFWANMNADILEQSGFENHPALKAVKPDCSFFDIGTSFAVLNYPTDVLEFIRSGQVKVHREDISHMSDHAIHLKNDLVLKSDAFIASAGWEWQPTIVFKPESLHAQLGIASKEYTESDKAFWRDLDQQADAEIFSRFPSLQTGKYPPHSEEDLKINRLDTLNTKQAYYEPQRLYRLIAPPGLAAEGDRTLAFAGAGANITHTIKSELTGLWIYAYFHDKLTIDPYRHVRQDKVFYETALMQRWSFRRHTYGFGRRFVDFVWDAIPWNDVLLKDLGMENLRKGGGNWFQRSWREAFVPYTTADYRGVTEEWLKRENVQKKKSGKAF